MADLYNETMLRLYFQRRARIYLSHFQNHSDLEIYKHHLSYYLIYFTSGIMWYYTFSSYFLIATKIPFYIGLAATVVHSFTLVFTKIHQSSRLAGYNMALTAFVFQVSYAYYTGGLYSIILNWVAICPLVVGVFGEKKDAYAVGLLCLVVTLLFAIFPSNINESTGFGNFLNHLSLTIGLIFLVTLFTVFFIDSNKKNEELQRLKLQEEAIKNIGNLSKSLSHEIFNHLQPIKILSDLILGPHSEGQNRQLMLQLNKNLEKSVPRIFELLTRLNQINNQVATEKPIKFSLKEVEQYLRQHFQREFDKEHIQFELLSNLQFLYSTPELIKSTLLALVDNSLAALRQAQSPKYVQISVAQVRGKYVWVVRDNGSGLNGEALERLFTPFSITHDVGQGTGLSLCIVKKKIETAGGTIRLVNPKDDTVFEFSLPVAMSAND
jgi:signal transduction histidine kinase